MLTQLRVSVLMLLVFTVLTGLIYPLAITGVAQVVFPRSASGSLIVRDGQTVGSELIGQPFDDPKYFWSRPSATLTSDGKASLPYNAAASSGSNLAVSNPAQADTIKARVAKLRESDPGNTAPIPIDLVTASGSGLDPHISPAAAAYQAARVARVRGMPVEQVRARIAQYTQPRQLRILGEPRVRVLELNLALDARGPSLR